MSNIELRNKILDEVSNLSEEELAKLDFFLNDLNKKASSKQSRIMQLSGIWNDIDNNSLDLLTTKLAERRTNNRRANHE